MATTLNAIQNVGSATSAFNTFNPLKNIPLFARVNWLFVLRMGCLTAGITYCLSNLYQAYQLNSCTSFGLDDEFKLVKCQALLDEAQEKDQKNAQPLLQQCESILDSIKDRASSHDKEGLLLKLVHRYVENDPGHSYQIAQKLSSSYILLNAAESIQKKHRDFDVVKLDSLFVRAFEAMIQENKSPPQIEMSSMDLNRFLKFAKAFHSVNNFELRGRCMANAVNLVYTFKDDLVRIRGFCQIAQCYQKIGGSEQILFKFYISSARSFHAKIASADLIEAHLILANAFFSLKEFEQMDQELNEVVKLIESRDPLQTVKNLYPLTKLIINIGKNEKSESSFKNFSVKLFIAKALEALAEAPPEELATKKRAKACLNIASIYQEGFINDPDSKEQALSQAFEKIQSLPESTDEEIKSKIELLFSLADYYEKDPNKTYQVLQVLEGLYDRCPQDGKSDLIWVKPDLGTRIVMYYYKAGVIDQSEAFFQKYLSNFKNKDKEVFSKINRLVTYATGDYYLLHEQKTQLEAAESLLSELTPSEYGHALARIIEGYLQVDRQKSLQLLENYAHQQARQKAQSHLIIATITAITMGIFYFYPQAAPVLSFGFAVVRLFY